MCVWSTHKCISTPCSSHSYFTCSSSLVVVERFPHFHSPTRSQSHFLPSLQLPSNLPNSSSSSSHSCYSYTVSPSSLPRNSFPLSCFLHTSLTPSILKQPQHGTQECAFRARCRGPRSRLPMSQDSSRGKIFGSLSLFGHVPLPRSFIDLELSTLFAWTVSGLWQRELTTRRSTLKYSLQRPATRTVRRPALASRTSRRSCVFLATTLTVTMVSLLTALSLSSTFFLQPVLVIPKF